jgi:hypothetical protein
MEFQKIFINNLNSIFQLLAVSFKNNKIICDLSQKKFSQIVIDICENFCS